MRDTYLKRFWESSSLTIVEASLELKMYELEFQHKAEQVRLEKEAWEEKARLKVD